MFKDDDDAADVEREDNQLEDDTKDNSVNIKSDKEIMEELDNQMKGIQINADLFQEDDNLDELDDIIDEEEEKEKDQ